MNGRLAIYSKYVGESWTMDDLSHSILLDLCHAYRNSKFKQVQVRVKLDESNLEIYNAYLDGDESVADTFERFFHISKIVPTLLMANIRNEEGYLMLKDSNGKVRDESILDLKLKLKELENETFNISMTIKVKRT